MSMKKKKLKKQSKKQVNILEDTQNTLDLI